MKDKGFAAAPGTHTLVGINQFRVRTRRITLITLFKNRFSSKGSSIFAYVFFPKRTISVVGGWVGVWMADWV